MRVGGSDRRAAIGAGFDDCKLLAFADAGRAGLVARSKPGFLLRYDGVPSEA